MKSIDRAIHVFAFICFVGYLIWLTGSIYRISRFIRTKQVSVGKVISLAGPEIHANNLPLKVRYYNVYKDHEIEGSQSVDRMKYREMVKAGNATVAYGKYSDEIYIDAYKVPNDGRFAISIMSFILVFLIVVVYLNNFRKYIKAKRRKGSWRR